MEYGMEELVDLVAMLANKLCGMQSTSISYEKAEQLMAAVQYCIAEEGVFDDEEEASVVLSGEPSAKEAYEKGYERVRKKAQRAFSLYQEIMESFEDYGNVFLRDTLKKGMPAFFQRYEMRFAPQETLLTLDYPVFLDLSKLSGIDAIDAYLHCIEAEQKFLGSFPTELVWQMLSEKNEDYRETPENLCFSVIRFLISKQETSGTPLTKERFFEYLTKKCNMSNRREEYFARIWNDAVVYENMLRNKEN